VKELLPYHSKEGEKGSVGFPTKTSTILKKKKGKEKVLKPNEESLEHIDFHLFSKSNGDVHSLILF
jgi:hypothetical protein